MRIRYLRLGLVTFVFALFCLVGCDELTWKRSFVPKDAEGGVLIRVQQTGDGGYIAAGLTQNMKLWLMRVNVFGGALWNETYDIECSNVFPDIILTEDKNIMIAAYNGDWMYTDNESDGWLLTLDFDGNILRSSNTDDVLSMYQPEDEEDALFLYGTEGADGHLGIFKEITTEGEEVFSRTFEVEDYELDFKAMDRTTDGGYILVGLVSSDWEYYSGRVLLVKTNGNGEEQWRSEVIGLGVPEIAAVLQDEDGGYLIAANGGLDDWDRAVCRIIKADNHGNRLWDRTYGVLPYSPAFAHCMTRTSDGNYIICGQRRLNDAPTALWLMKINFLGEAIWSKTFPDEPVDTEETTEKEMIGIDVHETKGGGFIVTGHGRTWNRDTSEYDLSSVLIKTDSEGNIP